MDYSVKPKQIAERIRIQSIREMYYFLDMPHKMIPFIVE